MISQENGSGTPLSAAASTNQGQRPQPVTLRQVAEAAGVSTATVSLVVNKKKAARISDETRKRVLDAIRELGYRPNAMAQTLVSGSSRFIGLVADAIATTPFAGQIIHGAQDEAWKHGYALLIANTEGNRELETDAIAMMLEYKVRGILYSTWFHRATDVPASLRESDFVLVNCFAEEPGARAVVPDEVQGGRSATEVLVNSIFIWNDFIFANTFVLSEELKTIPLGLQNYIGAMGKTDWTATFAAVCVTITPLLLVFLVLNKAMIQGLESGATKG